MRHLSKIIPKALLELMTETTFIIDRSWQETGLHLARDSRRGIWIWDFIRGFDDLCALREPGDPDVEMRHPANVWDQVQAHQWGGGGRQGQGQEDQGWSEVLSNETFTHTHHKVVLRVNCQIPIFSLCSKYIWTKSKNLNSQESKINISDLGGGLWKAQPCFRVRDKWLLIQQEHDNNNDAILILVQWYSLIISK